MEFLPEVLICLHLKCYKKRKSFKVESFFSELLQHTNITTITTIREIDKVVKRIVRLIFHRKKV